MARKQYAIRVSTGQWMNSFEIEIMSHISGLLGRIHLTSYQIRFASACAGTKLRAELRRWRCKRIVIDFDYTSHHLPESLWPIFPDDI